MPHSTYSRILDILVTLERTGPIDLFKLAEQIRGNRTDSFAIWRRVSGSSQAAKTYCSEAAIRRLIRYSAQLELVSIKNQRLCGLSRIGANAIKGENFSSQLGAQLVKFLRDHLSLPFDDLVKHINSVKPPKVPDSDTLFQTISSKRALDISQEEFRRLLYLLQRCDKLDAKVRKIYSLPID